MTIPCSSCEYHKSKSNPHQGKQIPNYRGKCTRPTGLCTEMQERAEKEAEEPASIFSKNLVSSETVQEAIAATALDKKDRGRLCALAVNAMQEARDRAQETGETPTDDELCDIAVRAILGSKREPALVPELTEEHATRDLAAQNGAAVVDQAVMDAEEVHKALGRIEGLEFLRRVGDVAIAQVFAEVRKSKKYKGLPYRDEDGNLRHVEDFNEFCKVKLGKSYTRCYELAQNLNVLGSDLYESAERIGFRAKDYRALKALPPEEQEVVKTALASDSKDEVVDILQDMAARHQAEKEAAKKEKDDLTADLEARGKLLKVKGKKLEQTEEELYRLKSLPPDANLELKLAREEEAVKELDKAFVTSLSEFNRLLMQVDAIITNDDVAMHTKQYAVQTVQMYCEDMNSNLANYGIAVDFEGMVNPEWMRDTAMDDLQEGRTESPASIPWER